MKNQTLNNKTFTTGCKFCRALNDGLCSNYCLLTKAEKKQLAEKIKIKVI